MAEAVSCSCIVGFSSSIDSSSAPTGTYYDVITGTITHAAIPSSSQHTDTSSLSNAEEIAYATAVIATAARDSSGLAKRRTGRKRKEPHHLRGPLWLGGGTCLAPFSRRTTVRLRRNYITGDRLVNPTLVSITPFAGCLIGSCCVSGTVRTQKYRSRYQLCALLAVRRRLGGSLQSHCGLPVDSLDCMKSLH